MKGPSEGEGTENRKKRGENKEINFNEYLKDIREAYEKMLNQEETNQTKKKPGKIQLGKNNQNKKKLEEVEESPQEVEQNHKTSKNLTMTNATKIVKEEGTGNMEQKGGEVNHILYERLPHILVNIEGLKLRALIDTGSAVDIINQESFQKLQDCT